MKNCFLYNCHLRMPMELSHLLGVSNEAEANYWAYRVCRSSKRPAVRYSAYFGLLPYVLVNASSVLTEEEFREWIKTIRPEVVKDYEYKRMYWNERYSIIRKSKFPQNPKRSVRFSGKRTKRSVQKRKARNTQKAETKVL